MDNKNKPPKTLEEEVCDSEKIDVPIGIPVSDKQYAVQKERAQIPSKEKSIGQQDKALN